MLSKAPSYAELPMMAKSTTAGADLQSPPSIILKPQPAASMSEKNSVFLNLSASQDSGIAAQEETTSPQQNPP